MARNNEGASDEATWHFSIQPTFYQTAAFAAICIVGLVVTVGSLWRLHVRQVRKQFSVLMGERARLSREIHDTLLQGLFGIALRCDAIADEVESIDPHVQEHFTRMRDDVKDYIGEARQSIWNLRSPMLEQYGLVGALREVGKRAVAGSNVAFRFDATRMPGPCATKVEEQLLRIGQEAVVNAVRHAQATEVRMEFRYDCGSIVLRVADNGVGFDLRSHEESQEHNGVTSMKERAETVGGSFCIRTDVGRGTELEARVPYAPDASPDS
jgi:signal transduction histidine kinase